MCNNFERSERIVIDNGLLCREMFCKGKNSELLVGKVYEDGKQTSRNIEYCGMFGWRFAEPGRKYRQYNGYYTAEVDEWNDWTPSLERFVVTFPSKKDVETVLTKYPSFKWVLAKTAGQFSITDIFHILPFWQKNPRLCETLCSMGAYRIALDGMAYNAKDPMKIVKFLSRNPKLMDESVRDIRLMLDKGLEWRDVQNYRDYESRYGRVSLKTWQYLNTQTDPSKWVYDDYLYMCKRAGKDLKDPYWLYPKDLADRHEKVRKQVEEIRKAEEAAEKAKEKGKFAKFAKMMEKLAWGDKKMKGLCAYLPKNVKEVQHQAKVLHQCLITCNYTQKVVDKDCVLVFIAKDGKPYATAELVRKGRKYMLGQFYGNEAKADCTAKEDAKKVLKQFIKKNNIKMVA